MKNLLKNLCLVNNSERVLQGRGKNIIIEPEKTPLWKQFLQKFKDPIIVVLLVVFVFSVGVSVYEIIYSAQTLMSLLEPLGILVALLLATGIGFIFEVKANKEFNILNKTKDERPVKVMRWLSEKDKELALASEEEDDDQVEDDKKEVKEDFKKDNKDNKESKDNKDKAKGENGEIEDKEEGINRLRPAILEIKRSDVVVGDIVKLDSGDEVPADGKILDSMALMVDESAFTGEMYASKSHPTDDTEDIVIEKLDAYPSDMLLRGSFVLEGNCFYQVTAVGMDTEEGKGAKILQEEPEVRTPLNSQLDRLGGIITKVSYIVAALIVIGRLIYYFFFDGDTANNTDFVELLSFILSSVMIAVTLIVVAVPEGLPMSVTISLALSMKKMLRQNNLVRRLHACETMGAATVVCTDKTGTLTRNKLRVVNGSEHVFTNIDTLARCISVNSTAELSEDEDGQLKVIGNPTEGALLYWLLKQYGLDYQSYRNSSKIIDQQAFSSAKKMMTTVAEDLKNGKTYKYIKGAPEYVLDMSQTIGEGHKRQTVLDELHALQSRSYRTLAFAIQDLSKGEDAPVEFIGFVAMADPIREDVPKAIHQAHQAGVNVIMVTGDTALTAKDIARQTGIIGDPVAHRENKAALGQNDNTGKAQGLTTNTEYDNEEPNKYLVLTGAEFEQMDDQKIKDEVLPNLKVLSRARPTDKSRLVTLLQEQGEVVAVTGDGTNDAPALKKAQVGLSMGDGTSQAKEASDITIIDNSFASINNAILWGRSLYQNIRRFILFQMTINVSACLIVLFGVLLGLDSPLNVTQMLWVNLIMDTFAAMALSSLPPDQRVMDDAPRDPKSQIINRKMGSRILTIGIIFFILLFGMWQLLWHLDITSAKDLAQPSAWPEFVKSFFNFSHIGKHFLSPYEHGVFFTFFVLLQFWNLFNAKYYNTNRSLLKDLWDMLKRPSSIKEHYSLGFVIVVAIVIGGQILIVNVFGKMFGVEALSLSDWMWLLLITCPVLIIGEFIRLFPSHRSKN